MLSEAFEPTRALLERVIELAPRVGLVLFVLLLGVVLSQGLRRTVKWAVQKSGLETVAERAGASRLLYAVGLKQGLAHLVGTLAWFGGLLITFSIVAELSGLPGVAEGIGSLLEFLPRLVAAGMVLLGGVLCADLLKTLLLRVGQKREDLEAPAFFASVAYYTVLAVSFTLAAEHLGLATGLINALIQIAAAAALFGVALAFALGSRGVVQQLIARHYAARAFRPGDHVRVDTVDGVVAHYGAVQVFVDTEEGRVSVPASRLLEGNVTLPR